MDAVGVSEIAAGAGPACRKRKAASLAGRLAHDVSILFGVGRHFGSQPGAKVSMTIMRAPQHGHGHGSTRGVSGVTSGSCWGLAAGGATLRSAGVTRKMMARLFGSKRPAGR